MKPIQTLQLDLSSNNITTSAWKHVLTSVPKAAVVMEVFNPSGSPLLVAQGATSSEVALPWTVMPGGSGVSTVEISAGKEISFKAVGTAVTSGYLIINLYA